MNLILLSNWINIYQMVNMGKLSFVAGAELPKKHFDTRNRID